MLDAANFIDFNILIKVCVKTIVQKFDFNSLENTVDNLKLDKIEIMKHKSIKEDKEITLEAVFHQIETQYRVVPDMMNQIYKSIPLSVIVRLKASAKIIGLLFIAFTSDEAYTSNYEIEISLDHKEAETKGNEILNAFNNEKFSIKNLLPKFGYKLDDNGNKHLITDEDEYEDEDDEESFLEAATHPYIFEFIWSIFLRDPQIYFQSVYCKFNRRDIIEIIYESTKRLEDVELNKRVSDILNNELSLAVIHGHILSTKYLVDIVRADITKFFYSRHFQDVFRIKDREKRLRFLDFLYYSKVRCWHHEFEYQAKEGNYENVVWLVKHGYKGWLTIQIVEEQGALDIRKLQVLSYLRSNRKWEELTYSSRGNFNGPKPRTF